ncbi:MAG TPA: hypothetical protein VLE97_06130 [Gaiellaceae bacterium]|nr:hypothetical protein [Gaiellaceae bacterium]
MTGSDGNAVSMKVSRCVGCATPIIGERLRCPACHEQHVAAIVFDEAGDNDATLPRQRSRGRTSVREALAAWLGACLIVLIVAVVLLAAARSCQ